MNEKSALIAMSGGVDSSCAAFLMREQGYECMGTTMRLYRNEDLGACNFRTCCSEKDIEDASEVAFQLDIPYEVLDFTADFQEQIIDKFIRTYEEGGTPNPCIDCNRFMKFEKLLDFAFAHGLNYIVPGHYARIERDEQSGRYVLYNLTQHQLAHTIFPLGAYSKTEIREMAEKQNFCNARKHDSQDICFVPDGDYVGFMEQYTGKHYPAGDYLDLEGNKVGTHEGAVRYTIGQRRGLRLPMGDRVYVCGKDMEKNTVTVGPESALFASRVIVRDMNWISVPELTGEMRVKAKLRYRQKEQPAVASPLADGRILLTFDEAQRAPAVGQSAVLYDGDTVVGGGTICAVPADTADCV